MSLEERLVDALAAYDRVRPTPDLFARVERGLAADREHRARVRRWSLGAAGVGAGAVLWTWQLASTDADGVVVVAPAAFAVVELVVLVGLVVVLGPAIRRFGAILVAAAFRLEPATAPVFLRLVDTAYYLVFTGFLLVTTSVPVAGTDVPLSPVVATAVDRLAGLLLLMGVLHAVTIAALPVLGLLHASAVRRHRRAAAGALAPAPDPAAERADRVARIVVWLALGYVVVELLVGLGMLLGVGISG